MIYADDEPDDTYFCGSRPNKRVRCISDPDLHEVRPCSEMYNIHPHKSVATKLGWRKLQVGKDIRTGQSEKHIVQRSVRVHATRYWHKAHIHRCTLIERHRSQTFKGLTDSGLKVTPLASVGVAHAEDLGATKARCLKSPPGSAGGRPSTSPMSTASPSQTNSVNFIAWSDSGPTEYTAKTTVPTM